MNETLINNITKTIQEEAQTGVIRECPYCHSHKIESMGFRDDKETVRRYRCKNPECFKSHSRDATTFLVLGNVETAIPIEANIKTVSYKKCSCTLNITPRTKERFGNLKIHDRETHDDILNRIIDKIYGKGKHDSTDSEKE